MMEFYKTFVKKKVVFLLFLLYAVNVLLFLYEQQREKSFSDIRIQTEYRLSLLERISQKQNIQKQLSWLKKQKVKNTQKQDVLSELTMQAEYIFHYPVYIQSVLDRADRMEVMSILQETNQQYSIENNEKMDCFFV